MDITSYLLGKKAGGGGSQGLKVVVVDELPATGSTDILYLVPKTTSKTNNIFDEYLYTEDGWELIGSTDIDLSNYVDMTTAQSISGKKTFTTLPESSIAPTTNNQLSNKKYVDDGLSGKQGTIDSSHKLSSDLVDDTNNTNKFVTTSEKSTWNNKSDFSGSYNDLTNKPTIPDDSELLHYKGHVASSDSLPSLGQTSGSLVNPYYSTTSSNFDDQMFNGLTFTQTQIDNILADSTLTTERTGYSYYILGASFNGNNVSGDRLCIAFNDPSQIKMRATRYYSYMSSTYTIRLVFECNASVSNPIHIYSKVGSNGVGYFDANSTKSGNYWRPTNLYNTSQTYSAPFFIVANDTTYPASLKYYTNASIKYTENCGENVDIDDTMLDLYGWGGENNKHLKSIQFTDMSNYIWNNNMIFLISTTANKINVQLNETTTKLNDTYTVGTNYDIYRRNESTQWDVFSKSPSVVTTISSASTNSDVPSALAVYNYIDGLNGNGVSY